MKIEMRTGLPDFSLSEETMKKIALVLRYAAEQEKVPGVYTVTVGFTDDPGIRRFNRRFRQLDRATDVLSFPMTDGREEWRNHSGVLLPGLDRPSLGDILISLEHCASQAEEYGHSFEREICFLALHGFLHLLGYDHMEEEERLEMETTAETYLSALGVTR
ncbi:MAG: rRNA maturation RNase YbeY [Clostridia bacterium]